MRKPRCLAPLCLAMLVSLPLDVPAHSGALDASGCHKDSSSGKRHCHPERARQERAPRYDASHPPRAGDEGVFYGPLVAVTDGDSLKARVQGVVMEFRLAEIDAPEHDQPYGAKAMLELTGLVRDQQLVLVPFDTDRYGRTVARVWVGSLDVNRELVRRGAAWFLSDYAKDDSLYDVEQQARREQRGLWALPAKDRLEPWEWRHRKMGPANRGPARK